MRLRILSAAIVVLIVALAYVAWNRSTSPPGAGATADANAPTAGTGPPAPATPSPGGMPPGMEITPPTEDSGVAWVKPKRWVEELASGMRLATYVIPAAPGVETATCKVYYFGPGQGGGIEANI